MAQSTPYGFDARELDELHTYLTAHEGPEGLMLDGVHGLLSAIVVGPEPIPASEWLPLIINESTGFEDAEQANRILSLLVRLYNSVIHELDALTYEPIFGEYETEDGDSELAAVGWCEGFSLGIDLRASVWESRMASDARLMDLLDPIIRISADEGMFGSDDDAPAKLDDEERETLLRAVGGAVADVQQYWRDQPPTPDEGAEPSADPKPLLRRRGGQWLH